MLNNLLKKLGVKSYEDLSSEEKETFRQWEDVLRGRQITDKDVKAFLDIEEEQATERLLEVDLAKETEIFRKVELKFIRKVKSFLNMPNVERELLKEQLENKI
jgi:L-2-hydroxyglutarate oxidase LhgO